MSEPAAEYHARKAVSASMAWRMIQECPAQAWWESPFNPDQPPAETARHFDIGTALHLAALEPDELAKRTWIIGHDNYRKKEAQSLRDEAYAAGQIPLLAEEERLVQRLRSALQAHPVAGPLLFDGNGQNEVSYSWEWEGVPCKARADRWTFRSGKSIKLIDLKSAASANPEAFQRAMWRDGHFLRAAWYLDGWNATKARDGRTHADNRFARAERYLFVVVSKAPPHLIGVYEIEERSLEWGRQQIRKVIDICKIGLAKGVWPGYSTGVQTIGLPTYAEYQLADREEADRHE